MSDSEKAAIPTSTSVGYQIDHLLSQYLADPEAPRVDEVRKMVEDLLLRTAELENRAKNLKTIAHQLEEYRDRYVDLYELAPVGYATLDEEGYVQEINLAGAELLGVDRNDLIGYSFGNHVSDQDREDVLGHIGRCCRDRQVLTFEAGIINKKGGTIAAQLRGVPIEPIENEAAFCKIAITDISERKAMEKAIRASEANYRAIFDTANDAIFVHDVDTGAILDANQKATEMYGYTAKEFQTMSVGDISESHAPYSQEEALHRLHEARDGASQLFTWRCRSKSGQLFWAEVNIKRTVLGGIPRLLAIVRDITEREPPAES